MRELTRNNLPCSVPGKVRESNFELLRIVSMLGIVLIHCLQHGVANPSTLDKGSMNYLLYELFGFIGRFGVICLVMVTGFFMIKRQINLRSLTSLIFRTFFLLRCDFFSCWLV